MCSERPGRCAAAVRSGRAEDRRGVHRQLHDQYRPLQRCALLFISITLYYLFQNMLCWSQLRASCCPSTTDSCPLACGSRRLLAWTRRSSSARDTTPPTERSNNNNTTAIVVSNSRELSEYMNARRSVPARRCPAARCAWVTRLESQTSPLWCPPLQETSPTGHQNTT